MNVFHIDVTGLTESEVKTARLAVMMSDFRPWWPLLVPLFIDWMRRQFETEGEFGGHAWAPLSPNYAAYKAVVYPGKGILIAEGDLRRAASSPSRLMTPTELILTIEDPKVVFHQEGTPFMPARPLLWGEIDPPPVIEELALFADRVADDMLRRAGFGRT